MIVWTVVLVGVAGGLGAAARFSLDTLITRYSKRVPIPIGTMIINVTGSFFLGVVTGLATAGLLTPELRLIAGTGFLAAYTTFSTASTQTADLFRARKGVAAVVNGLVMLVAAVAAAAIGLWLGSGGAG
ncbi:fluoride efflux transporter CrcB [Herbiconiux sp. CPCC 205763]|uniref:Fluoride-specific ion channel FluC n=1 Tax=Herbiconiux aconitum TaxID=2970913 RepID=A0ABT2GR99_9MICO|nr:fluoride efflux transporter CrcB [Herbiconiux aconitum]MCS5718752.1 fluoride efflux transporter CrcB [Herbiconiux aconitum]